MVETGGRETWEFPPGLFQRPFSKEVDSQARFGEGLCQAERIEKAL